MTISKQTYIDRRDSLQCAAGGLLLSVLATKTSWGEETIGGRQCTFQCVGHLSVGPSPAEYSIYGQMNPTVEERQYARESMEYLNSVERLRYSINQYQCGDLRSLKSKLVEFPPVRRLSLPMSFLHAIAMNQ